MSLGGYTSFNDDERLALDYLPLRARVLYLLMFKVHMDRETRIVGIKRRISRKAIQELLEVHRAPGSTRPSERPTIKEIRTTVKQLEGAGLANRVKGYEKTLVFFLPLASPKMQSVEQPVSDYSVSQSRGRGEAEQGLTRSAPQKVDSSACSEGMSTRGAPEEHTHSSGPHPVSSIQYHSVAAAVPDSARAREELAQVLLELFPDQKRQIEKHQTVQQMLDAWVGAGGCVHHVRKAYREIRKRQGLDSFGPAYLRGLVLEFAAVDGLQVRRDRNARREEQADRAMCQSLEQWAAERGLSWDPHGGEPYSTWVERTRIKKLKEERGVTNREK